MSQSRSPSTRSPSPLLIEDSNDSEQSASNQLVPTAGRHNPFSIDYILSNATKQQQQQQQRQNQNHHQDSCMNGTMLLNQQRNSHAHANEQHNESSPPQPPAPPQQVNQSSLIDNLNSIHMNRRQQQLMQAPKSPHQLANDSLQKVGEVDLVQQQQQQQQIDSIQQILAAQANNKAKQNHELQQQHQTNPNFFYFMACMLLQQQQQGQQQTLARDQQQLQHQHARLPALLPPPPPPPAPSSAKSAPTQSPIDSLALLARVTGSSMSNQAASESSATSSSNRRASSSLQRSSQSSAAVSRRHQPYPLHTPIQAPPQLPPPTQLPLQALAHNLTLPPSHLNQTFDLRNFAAAAVAATAAATTNSLGQYQLQNYSQINPASSALQLNPNQMFEESLNQINRQAHEQNYHNALHASGQHQHQIGCTKQLHSGNSSASKKTPSSGSVTSSTTSNHSRQMNPLSTCQGSMGSGRTNSANSLELNQHQRKQQAQSKAVSGGKSSSEGKLDNLKPAHSYIGLIGMCVLSSPEKRMVLNDIYQYILDHYPYYRNRGSGWRNSVRHNLSLNECFQKAGRAANGKGHYWTIHPANMEDFMNGDFRRRRAQRKVRRWNNMDVPSDESDDESMEDATRPPLPEHFKRSIEMHKQLEAIEQSTRATPSMIGPHTNTSAQFGQVIERQRQQQQQQSVLAAKDEFMARVAAIAAAAQSNRVAVGGCGADAGGPTKHSQPAIGIGGSGGGSTLNLCQSASLATFQLDNHHHHHQQQRQIAINAPASSQFNGNHHHQQ